MIVYVVTLVYFLSGGMVLTDSVEAPTQTDCQAAISPIIAGKIGTKMDVGDGEKATVLDAQGYCKKFTRSEHA